MKLELFYPAKPYVITQAFGIYNPAYQQFGFTKHNGIDFLIDADSVVRAMCDGIVTEVRDYIQDGKYVGAGKAVRYRTLVPVEAEDHTSYAEFMYMHAKEQLVSVGQKVKAGDPIIIADNTGFSTGPHTHISAYFVNENGSKQLIGQSESDYCFDFSKYYNGYYADDATRVIGILQQVISLLKKFLGT